MCVSGGSHPPSAQGSEPGLHQQVGITEVFLMWSMDFLVGVYKLPLKEQTSSSSQVSALKAE